MNKTYVWTTIGDRSDLVLPRVARTPVKSYAYVQCRVWWSSDLIFVAKSCCVSRCGFSSGVKLIFKLLKLSPLIQPSSSSRTRQINREQIRFFLAEKSSPSSSLFLLFISYLYFVCRIHGFVRCGFSRVSSGISSFAPPNPTVSSRSRQINRDQRCQVEVGQINREQLRFFLAGISSPFWISKPSNAAHYTLPIL